MVGRPPSRQAASKASRTCSRRSQSAVNPCGLASFVSGIILSLVAVLALGSFAQAGAIIPVRLTARVEAHDCWYRTVTFEAGEVARVFVDGDGDTDLDLYVYDQHGNLVAYDDDDTDTCYV